MEWCENTRCPGSRLLEASANPWSQPSGHYGVSTCDWDVFFAIMCQFFMNKFWQGLHVHMHLVFCKFSCGFIFSHCCISMHVCASIYGVSIFLRYGVYVFILSRWKSISSNFDTLVTLVSTFFSFKNIYEFRPACVNYIAGWQKITCCP